MLDLPQGHLIGAPLSAELLTRRTCAAVGRHGLRVHSLLLPPKPQPLAPPLLAHPLRRSSTTLLPAAPSHTPLIPIGFLFNYPVAAASNATLATRDLAGHLTPPPPQAAATATTAPALSLTLHLSPLPSTLPTGYIETSVETPPPMGQSCLWLWIPSLTS